jgi:hypothetical protein
MWNGPRLEVAFLLGREGEKPRQQLDSYLVHYELYGTPIEVRKKSTRQVSLTPNSKLMLKCPYHSAMYKNLTKIENNDHNLI